MPQEVVLREHVQARTTFELFNAVLDDIVKKIFFMSLIERVNRNLMSLKVFCVYNPKVNRVKTSQANVKL